MNLPTLGARRGCEIILVAMPDNAISLPGEIFLVLDRADVEVTPLRQMGTPVSIDHGKGGAVVSPPDNLYPQGAPGRGIPGGPTFFSG